MTKYSYLSDNKSCKVNYVIKDVEWECFGCGRDYYFDIRKEDIGKAYFCPYCGEREIIGSQDFEDICELELSEDRQKEKLKLNKFRFISK